MNWNLTPSIPGRLCRGVNYSKNHVHFSKKSKKKYQKITKKIKNHKNKIQKNHKKNQKIKSKIRKSHKKILRYNKRFKQNWTICIAIMGNLTKIQQGSYSSTMYFSFSIDVNYEIIIAIRSLTKNYIVVVVVVVVVVVAFNT